MSGPGRWAERLEDKDLASIRTARVITDVAACGPARVAAPALTST
ncbi:hypothetical protein [Streptomyces sp. NPDC054961]